jgi:sterol desaturase/sphingolipid hydroxylase (fatty acid hydroxylase superfamily)
VVNGAAAQSSVRTDDEKEMFGEFLREHAVNLAFYGAVIAVFALAERWRPVEKQTARAFLFNFALFASMYLGLSGYYYGMVKLHHAIEQYRIFHLGLPNFLGRDFHVVELMARFVLFVLAADLIKYWMHRAMHQVPLLWRFHRAHHSDRHFNASTNLREQWLGTIYGDAVFTLIAAPLFGALSTPIPLTVAYVAYGFFAHSNLRLPLGRLTPLMVGPQYHRIHHSRLPQHANVNYSSFFPLFDLAFGTYYKPARDEFPPTGLAGEQHDSLWRIQLLPFQRATPPARLRNASPVPAESISNFNGHSN